MGMRELAELAGVSVGTVSQALRGVGSTSEKTRVRIQALAKEHGYVPDPLMAEAGRRHRAGRTGRVECPLGVLSCRSPETMRRHSAARFTDHCMKAIELIGSQSYADDVGDFEQFRRAVRVWRHRGVRGIILTHMYDPSWVHAMDWEGMAVVFLGGRYAEMPFNSVSMDYPKCFQLALEKAMETGSRVGVIFLRHELFEVMDDAMRMGILNEFLESYPDRFVKPLCVQFAEGRQRIPEWFEQEEPGLVVGVGAAKGYLPEDLPFIYHTADQLREGEMGVPERFADLARISVNVLSDMIWRKEFDKQAYPNALRLSPVWEDLRSPCVLPSCQSAGTK